jgi:hypothetical protein
MAPAIGSKIPSKRVGPRASGSAVSSVPSPNTRMEAPGLKRSGEIAQIKPLKPSWLPMPTSSRRRPLAVVSSTSWSLTNIVILTRRRPKSRS